MSTRTAAHEMSAARRRRESATTQRRNGQRRNENAHVEWGAGATRAGAAASSLMRAAHLGVLGVV
jgi:hypothetical protein